MMYCVMQEVSVKEPARYPINGYHAIVVCRKGMRRFNMYQLYLVSNIIEGLNRQFRQVTKNKPYFLTMILCRTALSFYLLKNVERWWQCCWNWDIVSNRI